MNCSKLSNQQQKLRSKNLFWFIIQGLQNFKILGADTLWMPIHKVHTLGVFTPCCLSSLGYLFDDPFTNNVRTLSSIPPYQKNFIEIVLFCFLPEKKSFIDFPLFWQPPKSEVQCLGFNIFLSTCWDNFFTMAQAKTKFKKVLSQTFF